ncbi:circularly permuted type 2 ATP-grasp protein [Azoarcus taiwanensis]|uniref:Circularly permuted type 2 ATP-grasp protein n=1 Tax=Azoarcus taiwanensis TaxID=666964 RepID=A0A972FHV3_9RHOO|nr:circularly permuted type 2 ATP-grasp protein [Azoarcus taiwanensis]NMG02581.1 circularly permuted type 2 ATP-grasp protein [Azoarcus taiwanensis]
MSIDWKSYDPKPFFDELIAAPGKPRPAARTLADYLASLDDAEIRERKRAAELAIVEMGISFTVYSEGENIDRAWPFDIIPRVIPRKEWERVQAGLVQRLSALNMFIDDVYNAQRIVRDKVVPEYVFANSRNFRKQCVGHNPPHGVWAHICGSDLVRDGDGTFYVLEDNLRVPSGVSYMLENRQVTKRVFPEVFESSSILPVDEYTSQLFDMLASISPRPLDYPTVAVLTPGVFNSAYFEHSYLAQRMGAQLVEGADLVVAEDDYVYMRTIEGLERVDVIYRRIDDEFMDPEAFRADSMLGVPGLMRAWRAGNVGLANAPGSGVADDKVIYTFVPAMIKYYLDQEPIIPNVPTWLCTDEKEREHVIAHLDELVVKPANESGGYGMLVGPHSTKKQRAEFAELIRKDPRNYIAQPTLNLSVAPTLCDEGLEPRHLDLRPFILQGVRTDVTAGGLTRVAMRKGSLVVNSSQGGGSKDTWIVDEEA